MTPKRQALGRGIAPELASNRAAERILDSVQTRKLSGYVAAFDQPTSKPLLPATKQADHCGTWPVSSMCITARSPITLSAAASSVA